MSTDRKSGDREALAPTTRLYGPVPSRRLGRSLGVDLVPLKYCTYDCLYCQLGGTTNKTLERSSFFPARGIVEEAGLRLAESRPDVITLAGSGEPTLEARLGDIMEGLKGITNIPLVLLTNGSLLWDEDVQRAASLADLVLPSLDAGDEEFFAWVNRPASGLSLAQVVEGMRSFRSRYKGRIWLEVMILAGRTDREERLRSIAAAAATFRPDRIQLNTPVRPGGHKSARPLEPERLSRLCAFFAPRAEVVADPVEAQPEEHHKTSDAAPLLALLRRRPCTLEDLCRGLDLHPNEVSKALARLEAAGKLHRTLSRKATFYVAGPSPAGGSSARRGAP